MTMTNFLDLAQPGITELSPYQPGKPVEELERELGISNIIKLASNENPRGLPPAVIETLNASAEELPRYPDGSAYLLKRRLQDATQTVSEGMSLRMSLEQVGQFPPMLLHMVGSGEQSGELDAMLQRVAGYQQAEVERIVATIVKMFEPLMLLLMGGVVLFIVMAVLLPILSMNQLV